MNAKVADLMTEGVISTEPHASIERVRGILERNKVGAVPVVDSEKHPVGIVSATDLIPSLKPSSPVSTVMTEKVYTVPKYDDVSVAARIMRNHKIHRVVVTDEQKVVGMISAFDLLELVEDHRWVATNRLSVDAYTVSPEASTPVPSTTPSSPSAAIVRTLNILRPANSRGAYARSQSTRLPSSSTRPSGPVRTK